MVTVEFASSLRRHVDCPTQQIALVSLREVIEAALRAALALGHYVFDDQRAVRKHVAVFINRQMVQDRLHLNQALTASGMKGDYLPDESADEGSTQDPHCMVQCTSQPDVLWVSANAGKQWQCLSNDLPPIAMVHFSDL